MRYWGIHDALVIDCSGHELELVIGQAAIIDVVFDDRSEELSNDVGYGYERTDYVEGGLDGGGAILEIGAADVAVFSKDTALGEMLCVALSRPGEGSWNLAAQLVDYGGGWQSLSVFGNDPDIEDIFDIDNGVMIVRR